MVVLLDYSSDDPSCLAIKRGESVQVVRHEGDMALVRNERGKEGFIPKANLIAPYSNRRQARGSVGSKSSLLCDSEAGDPSHRPIPMFHVASGNSLLSQRSPPVVEGGGGGKSSNRASLEAESASSPPPPGVGLGTSPESNGASSSSEVVQKHSPSSSSGVASSVGSHHPHHHHHDYQVHNGAAVQEQRSSFSSLEDDVLVGGGQPPPPPLPPNPHRTRTSPLVSVAGLEKRNANTSSDETISRGTNSPSLSAGGSSTLHRPLPPPPTVTTASSSFQAQRSDSPRNSNNGRVIRESEQTPPPVPPRDVFVIKAPGPREGEYSSPADALHPNASHQERLAHYQRERGGSKGGGGEGGVRVRSSTMYRTKPYNRQTPPTSGVNFEVDYLPPRDAPEAQTRRPAQTGRRRFSEDQEAMREKAYTDGSTPASSVNGDVFLSNQGKVSKFKKCLWGLFVVTVEFAAGDENEISVSKGEHVSVWNRDDPDWFWVVRHTTGSEEGFVPSRCLHEMATNDAKHTPGKHAIIIILIFVLRFVLGLRLSCVVPLLVCEVNLVCAPFVICFATSGFGVTVGEVSTCEWCQRERYGSFPFGSVPVGVFAVQFSCEPKGIDGKSCAA